LPEPVEGNSDTNTNIKLKWDDYGENKKIKKGIDFVMYKYYLYK
jgi:hypothetical protein